MVERVKELGVTITLNIYVNSIMGGWGFPNISVKKF